MGWPLKLATFCCTASTGLLVGTWAGCAPSFCSGSYLLGSLRVLLLGPATACGVALAGLPGVLLTGLATVCCPAFPAPVCFHEYFSWISRSLCLLLRASAARRFRSSMARRFLRSALSSWMRFSAARACSKTFWAWAAWSSDICRLASELCKATTESGMGSAFTLLAALWCWSPRLCSVAFFSAASLLPGPLASAAPRCFLRAAATGAVVSGALNALRSGAVRAAGFGTSACGWPCSSACTGCTPAVALGEARCRTGTGSSWRGWTAGRPMDASPALSDGGGCFTSSFDGGRTACFPLRTAEALSARPALAGCCCAPATCASPLWGFGRAFAVLVGFAWPSSRLFRGCAWDWLSLPRMLAAWWSSWPFLSKRSHRRWHVLAVPGSWLSVDMPFKSSSLKSRHAGRWSFSPALWAQRLSMKTATAWGSPFCPLIKAVAIAAQDC
mmetsp:Transcript_9978/g.31693  ORF Transcript_9978/g.31693 Transcript_9978/m.31693 type:complete len:443 (-) Transcript_9978:163-1491(-)